MVRRYFTLKKMTYAGIATGCYDIDGTEIYAGDVLEHSYGEYAYTLTVLFDAGRGEFMVRGGMSYERLYDLNLDMWRVVGHDYDGVF